MGCGFSDESWQEEMEAVELQIFQLGGIDESKLTRKYTMIKIEGVEHAVRTHIYNDDKTKKTLLCTHGFGMSAVMNYFMMMKPLAEHYRLVMVDNGGWGLNTKYMGTKALESPEAAEEFIFNWWESLVDKLTEQGELPDKFHFTAHSAGGL